LANYLEQDNNSCVARLEPSHYNDYAISASTMVMKPFQANIPCTNTSLYHISTVQTLSLTDIIMLQFTSISVFKQDVPKLLYTFLAPYSRTHLPTHYNIPVFTDVTKLNDSYKREVFLYLKPYVFHPKYLFLLLRYLENFLLKFF